MSVSTSYVMVYSQQNNGTRDWIGGLPAHLPGKWPTCPLCAREMSFVGQLYSCEWFPIEGSLALQFYVCDYCRESFNGMANDRLPIHMEALPSSAILNTRSCGVCCPLQPRLYISYQAVDDSLDQETFKRLKLVEDDLPDTHLRDDKIGGMFPYDGEDGPKITKANRQLAQFSWRGIHGPLYLYQSKSKGIYFYHYR